MAKGYKMKTNKATAKRFRFTGSGKVKHKKAGLRHFMRRKKSDTKRNLRKAGYLSPTHVPHIKKLMPYG